MRGPSELINISEICSHLHAPRRTLHRAFHEALGTGPIAFLRHRRLCATSTALRAPEDIRTIAEIAMQFGFQDLGRFAGYYHQLFGEYPSEAAAAPATAWSATTANQRMSAATSGRHQLRSRMLRACHGLAMLGLDAEGPQTENGGEMTPPHVSDYPICHSPLWMSNFTRPSSRILRSRDWQASSFGRLARRMSW